MASDQAQVDAAALNLSYCRIVAPVSGRIGLRQVDVGNYVQISDANGIVVITQLEPISVIFSTPEDNLPQIAARMKAGAILPATVFDRANVKELATGELTTIDNQIDTTTGTFKARASSPIRTARCFPTSSSTFACSSIRCPAWSSRRRLPSSSGRTAISPMS